MSVAFQTQEGFDGIAPAAFIGSGFCKPIDGGPGCGANLGRVGGPMPSYGSGNAVWTSTNYTLITGWDGSGQALSVPTNCYFTFEAANAYDTQLLGLRYKVGSLAATQTVAAFGSSTSGLIVLEIVLTTGKWRLRSVASGTIATSTEAAVLGTWYHVEWGAYIHPSAGSLRVQINGVSLTWDAAVTNVNTQLGAPGVGMTGVNFNTTVGAIDDVYLYAGDGGFSTDDFKGTATRLPHMSFLRPASQGANQAWDRYVDSFHTFVGGGNATNYQYVDDVQCDAPLTELASATNNQRDSWIMTPLPAAAGEILAVQSNVCTVAVADFQNDNAHEFRIGGTPYTNGEDLNYDILYTGSQYHWTCRYWPNNPAARGWDAAIFQAGIEFGVARLGTGVTVYVSQAFLYVLWLEPLPVDVPPPEDVGAECAPCDEAHASRHFDSFLVYDGVNTDLTKTVTLALSPGANWTTPGLSHTLSSAALFLSTDLSPAPAKAFRIGNPEGDFVIVDVTGFTNTSQLTVTNRTPVPLSLQAVATSTWARMVKSVAGLGHLEAEIVYALLDGIPAGPFTVAAGVVTFAIHAAVAPVGLKITAELETLDFDIPNQGRPIAARQKLTGDVFVWLKTSRQFQAGDPNNPTGMKPYDLRTKTQQNNTPNLLLTGTIEVKTEKKWEKAGRVYIRSEDGLPLTISAIEPGVALGGNP